MDNKRSLGKKGKAKPSVKPNSKLYKPKLRTSSGSPSVLPRRKPSPLIDRRTYQESPHSAPTPHQTSPGAASSSSNVDPHGSHSPLNSQDVEMPPSTDLLENNETSDMDMSLLDITEETNSKFEEVFAHGVAEAKAEFDSPSDKNRSVLDLMANSDSNGITPEGEPNGDATPREAMDGNNTPPASGTALTLSHAGNAMIDKRTSVTLEGKSLSKNRVSNGSLADLNKESSPDRNSLGSSPGNKNQGGSNRNGPENSLSSSSAASSSSSGTETNMEELGDTSLDDSSLDSASSSGNRSTVSVVSDAKPTTRKLRHKGSPRAQKTTVSSLDSQKPGKPLSPPKGVTQSSPTKRGRSKVTKKVVTKNGGKKASPGSIKEVKPRGTALSLATTRLNTDVRKRLGKEINQLPLTKRKAPAGLFTNSGGTTCALKSQAVGGKISGGKSTASSSSGPPVSQSPSSATSQTGDSASGEKSGEQDPQGKKGKKRSKKKDTEVADGVSLFSSLPFPPQSWWTPYSAFNVEKYLIGEHRVVERDQALYFGGPGGVGVTLVTPEYKDNHPDKFQEKYKVMEAMAKSRAADNRTRFKKLLNIDIYHFLRVLKEGTELVMASQLVATFRGKYKGTINRGLPGWVRNTSGQYIDSVVKESTSTSRLPDPLTEAEFCTQVNELLIEKREVPELAKIYQDMIKAAEVRQTGDDLISQENSRSASGEEMEGSEANQSDVMDHELSSQEEDAMDEDFSQLMDTDHEPSPRSKKKIHEEVKKAKKSIKRNVVNNELKCINQKLDKLSSNMDDVMEGIEFLMRKSLEEGSHMVCEGPSGTTGSKVTQSGRTVSSSDQLSAKCTSTDTSDQDKMSGVPESDSTGVVGTGGYTIELSSLGDESKKVSVDTSGEPSKRRKIDASELSKLLEPRQKPLDTPETNNTGTIRKDTPFTLVPVKLPVGSVKEVKGSTEVSESKVVIKTKSPDTLRMGPPTGLPTKAKGLATKLSSKPFTSSKSSTALSLLSSTGSKPERSSKKVQHPVSKLTKSAESVRNSTRESARPPSTSASSSAGSRSAVKVVQPHPESKPSSLQANPVRGLAQLSPTAKFSRPDPYHGKGPAPPPPIPAAARAATLPPTCGKCVAALVLPVGIGKDVVTPHPDEPITYYLRGDNGYYPISEIHLERAMNCFAQKGAGRGFREEGGKGKKGKLEYRQWVMADGKFVDIDDDQYVIRQFFDYLHADFALEGGLTVRRVQRQEWVNHGGKVTREGKGVGKRQGVAEDKHFYRGTNDPARYYCGICQLWYPHGSFTKSQIINKRGCHRRCAGCVHFCEDYKLQTVLEVANLQDLCCHYYRMGRYVDEDRAFIEARNGKGYGKSLSALRDLGFPRVHDGSGEERF